MGFVERERGRNTRRPERGFEHPTKARARWARGRGAGAFEGAQPRTNAARGAVRKGMQRRLVPLAARALGLGTGVLLRRVTVYGEPIPRLTSSWPRCSMRPRAAGAHPGRRPRSRARRDPPLRGARYAEGPAALGYPLGRRLERSARLGGEARYKYSQLPYSPGS